MREGRAMLLTDSVILLASERRRLAMGVLDLVPRYRTSVGAAALLNPAPGPVASFRRELYRRFDDSLRTIEIPRSAIASLDAKWPLAGAGRGPGAEALSPGMAGPVRVVRMPAKVANARLD